MEGAMQRVLRSFAAVLAAVALVAMLPAPCGCAPERTAPAPAAGHECCALPVGVSAADGGCCNEAPASAEAVPPSGMVASVLAAASVLLAALPSAPAEIPRPSIVPAPSPPPTVLRI
jgi:hypothetical protein